MSLLEREERRLEDERRTLEGAWRAIWPEKMEALGGAGAPEARVEWRERIDALFALYAQQREHAAAWTRECEARSAAVLALRELLWAGESGIGSEDEGLEGWIERAEIEQARRTAERERARDRVQARERAQSRQNAVRQVSDGYATTVPSFAISG